MPVEFGSLIAGAEYDRNQLAELWGYESYHAFGRGVFTPRDQDIIVLFMTERQQSAHSLYENRFDGDLLWMDGAEAHGSDRRLVQSLGRDEVHLFYREEQRSQFTYRGEVTLVESFLSEGSTPSRFVFSASRQLLMESDGELERHLNEGNGFSPEAEGRRLLRMHFVYERSPRNRARALDVHGHKCSVCGFDFDLVYGADLAAGYIEVHHLRSITEIKGEVVNPDTDLAPVCANCHCMAHRRRGQIIPLDELKRRIRELR